MGRGHVHPPRAPRDPSVFYVDLDIALNGAPAWRWTLTRVHLPLCRHYAHLRGAPDEDGKPVFITSKHSHIEDHSRERGWRYDISWSWLEATLPGADAADEQAPHVRSKPACRQQPKSRAERPRILGADRGLRGERVRRSSCNL